MVFAQIPKVVIHVNGKFIEIFYKISKIGSMRNDVIEPKNKPLIINSGINRVAVFISSTGISFTAKIVAIPVAYPWVMIKMANTIA